MRKLSKLHKIAGIELARNGMGVSTSARKFIRELYASQGNQIWAQERNEKINDLLASLFSSANPVHRFKLRTGEAAEIRLSDNFFMVGAIRRNTYDIIFIQKNYRQTKPEISKRRLENLDWLDKTK